MPHELEQEKLDEGSANIGAFSLPNLLLPTSSYSQENIPSPSSWDSRPAEDTAPVSQPSTSMGRDSISLSPLPGPALTSSLVAGSVPSSFSNPFLLSGCQGSWSLPAPFWPVSSSLYPFKVKIF